MRDGSWTLIVPGHSESAVRRSGLGSARSGLPESLLHLFPSPTPSHHTLRHPLRGPRLRNTRASAAGEDPCARESSRKAVRMCKGRRTAHAERWPAREPECLRGHPGPLRANPGPLCAWAHRWASGTAALRGWSRSVPWVERTAGATLKGPGTRAPSLSGRREGARGARGAGQHESAADSAETAQPVGGPGAGNRAPPLPGPHQRGEPTGEREPGPRGGGIACCGTRS